MIRAFLALPAQTTTPAQVAQYLAEHPALLTVSARPYGPTLMWSLEYERSEAALALVRAGAVIPSAAIALAARGGLDVVLSELFARGARDTEVFSAMHAAAKVGKSSTLRLLLTHGGRVAAQDEDGMTPLHLAVIDRRLAAMRVLIAAKAPLEVRDTKGRTPLFWGPFAYRPQAKHIYQKLGQPHDTVFVDPGEAVGIKLLLEAGAKVDAVDQAGDTPLHEAVRLGSLRGAAALLAGGAKATVKNRQGETPRALAKQRGNAEMIALLK